MKPYVYIYLDPTRPGKFVSPMLSLTISPFYVGKGTGTRYKFETKTEEKASNNVLRNRIIRIREIQEPEIIIIPCESEDEAFSLEFMLTCHFGIFPKGLLCNFREGGRGGFRLSNETKAKLSGANSGANNPNFGRKWSPEQREKWMKSYKSKDRSRSAESMQKTWEGRNRAYLVRDTNGNETLVTDLTKYCQENNLPLSALRNALKNGNRVISGKRRKSRVEGYEIFYVDGK